MNFGRAIVVAAATLGLFGGTTPVQPQNASRIVGVARSGQQANREIESNSFGGFGIGRIRGCGNPPDVWGRSRACRRMVLKNRILTRKAGRP